MAEVPNLKNYVARVSKGSSTDELPDVMIARATFITQDFVNLTFGHNAMTEDEMVALGDEISAALDAYDPENDGPMDQFAKAVIVEMTDSKVFPYQYLLVNMAESIRRLDSAVRSLQEPPEF